LDGDPGAWERRILWIKYDNPPPKEVIPDFDKILLKTEGSGILNWALEGAVKLLKNGGEIPRSNEQIKRVNDLLEQSDCINIFAAECIEPAPGKDVTGNELLVGFSKYCKSRNWEILSPKVFHTNLKTVMLKLYNSCKRNDILRDGKSQRGYSGVQLATP
jgi:phage/plasmid-associated DNA primase